MKIEIRLAELADVMDVVDHDIRHHNEPGFNGLLSHPFEPGHPWDKIEIRKQVLLSISKDLYEEQWQRIFIIEANGKVLGSLNLKNNFSGSLHRAQLGMGLEIPLRGQGIGKQILQMAISWAKTQESLTWIDLSVFAHNIPAIKLYKSLGFNEVATLEDRFRINGVSIDDIFMTLKLK